MSYFVDFVRADSRNLPKVDNVMIMEYIASSNKHNLAEIRGAKILMSSRESYLNTAVGYVQVSRNGSTVAVKSKVVPEHRVANKLYTVTCTIDEANNVIMDSSCDDCAAAAGGCKKSSEPSSTSVACYWTKPSLSSARTAHVLSKEIFLKAKKPKLVAKDSSVLLQFQEECRSKQMKNSLILMLDKSVQNVSCNIFDMMLEFIGKFSLHTYKNFQEYCKSVLTKNMIEEINKKTMRQADSKYWHSIRQARLTASKLHEAAHCRTDGTLVEQILGGYKVPETKAIQRGKKLENEVLKEVSKRLKITINKSGFVLIDGILGASPDGINEDLVVEIKCPVSEKSFEKYIKNDVIQNKFKVQLQCQMLACGKSKGLFCVADPKFETTKNVHILWEDFDADTKTNLPASSCRESLHYTIILMQFIYLT